MSLTLLLRLGFTPGLQSIPGELMSLSNSQERQGGQPQDPELQLAWLLSSPTPTKSARTLGMVGLESRWSLGLPFKVCSRRMARKMTHGGRFHGRTKRAFKRGTPRCPSAKTLQVERPAFALNGMISRALDLLGFQVHQPRVSCGPNPCQVAAVL